MKKLCLAGLCFLSTISIAQINNLEYETIRLTGPQHIMKSAAISPDNSTLAVSTLKDKIFLFDANSYEEKAKYDIAEFTNGGMISYTRSGKYLILEKLRLVDWNENKDNKRIIAVVDVDTGKEIFRKAGLYDLDISPNNDRLAYLEDGKVTVCSFPDVKFIAEKKDEFLKTALCFDATGDNLYVSHGFSKDDLKKDPRFEKNKDAKKFAKFQQTVSGFNTETLEKQIVYEDNFDEIYEMRISQNGRNILIYAKQDMRVNATRFQGFVLQLEIESGRILREQFNTNIFDPIFQENPQKNLFGITSGELMDMSQSVILYDMSTNDIYAKFDVDARWLEGLKGMVALDGSAAFVFSPDGKYLLTMIGNNLYKWKIKELKY